MKLLVWNAFPTLAQHCSSITTVPYPLTSTTLWPRLSYTNSDNCGPLVTGSSSKYLVGLFCIRATNCFAVVSIALAMEIPQSFTKPLILLHCHQQSILFHPFVSLGQYGSLYHKVISSNVIDSLIWTSFFVFLEVEIQQSPISYNRDKCS